MEGGWAWAPTQVRLPSDFTGPARSLDIKCSCWEIMGSSGVRSEVVGGLADVGASGDI